MSHSPLLNGIVLAAGQGSRLRPLTTSWPKALVPILTVPAIDFALAALAEIGVARIGINLHHLAAPLLHHLDRIRWKDRPSLIPSVEDDLLGTGGGIARLAQRLDGRHLVVRNADILADIDLPAMAAHHIASGATATLAVSTGVTTRPTLRVTAAHTVADILQSLGAGPNNADYLGVCILDADYAQSLPEPGCLVRDGLIPLLRGGGRLAAWVHRGFWQDLGTAHRLLAAQRALLRGAMILSGEPAERVRTSLARGRTAFPGITIVPPVAFGESVTLEAGSSIGPDVVVGHRCRVAAGCHLEDTLVLDDVSVPSGTQLAGAILSPAHTIAVRTLA